LIGVTMVGTPHGFAVSDFSLAEAAIESFQSTPVPPDGLVEFPVLALLNQMSENLQHTPCAAVKGQRRDSHVALAAATGHDGSLLIDLPKTPKRKFADHGADLNLQVYVTHLSSSSDVEILDSPRRGWFARLRRNGKNNRTMALPHLQF